MRSVWFMALNNIRKRVTQNVIIAVLIIATMTLLMTSFIIVQNSQNLYQRIASQLDTSNIFLFTDEEYEKIEDAKQYWNNIDKVKSNIAVYNIYLGNIEVNDEKIEGGFYLYKTDRNSAENKIKIVQGEDTQGPSQGEIWLSTGYAYSKDISLGDEIVFTLLGKEESFNVSGIFVDPPYCVPMSGMNEAFVSEKDLEKFSNDKNNTYVIKLNLEDYSNADKLIMQWQDSVGVDFNGTVLREKEIMSQSSFQVNLSAIIMLITAIILIIVISLVIIYSVSSDVYSNYKNIGILLACGYDAVKVRLIYCIQYCFIYLISAPISSFVAVRMTNWILNEFLLKSLGFNGTMINWQGVVVCVLIFVLILILISVYSAAKGATKVEVIDILLMRDSNTGKEKERKRDYKRSSVGILMSRMQKQKIGQYIFVGTMAFAVTFITLVIINLIRPMMNTAIFREYTGIANEDITLIINPYMDKATEEMKQVLNDNDKILGYYTSGEESLVLAEQEGIISTTVMTKILGSDAVEEKVPVFEGSNPRTNNEIAISSTLAELYGKEVGDIILLSENGDKQELIITGIFLTTENSGKVIRVGEKLMESEYPEYKLDRFVIELTDDKYEDEITEKLLKYDKSLYVVSINDAINTATDAVMSGVTMAIVIINVVMWGILIIIIFNVILINIIRERKVFGIMGVIGFSTAQEKSVLISPLMIASFVGFIIGIIMIYIVGIPIMNNVYTFVGVRECPFSLTILDYSLLGIIYLVFVFGASLIPATKLQMISSRDLILED